MTVANVVRSNHENHLFGHVGRMVGNALEVLGHPNYPQTGLHFGGVLGHMGDHRADDGCTMLIHRVIASQNLVGSGVVPPNESIECTVQHVQRRTRHRGEFAAGDRLPGAVLFNRPLADIDGLIADAFEVRDEAQRSRQKPKIVGDGLSERQHPYDERVDLELVAVDVSVENLELARDLQDPPAERSEGQLDDPFTPSAHREQAGLQLAKLGLELSAAVRGRCPLHLKHNGTEWRRQRLKRRRLFRMGFVVEAT
jgi:hypothetical protein